MSIHYENWAKGGAGPGFSVASPEIYVQNFNWLGNWLKVYFAEKGINTLAGISSIALVVFITFYSKKKKEYEQRTYKLVLLITFILFLEWFWKHPALRYGGFCLWALLIFIPTSVLLERYSQEKTRTKLVVLLLITIFIFMGRNFKRISTEIKQYNYKPFVYTFYYVNEDGKENYFTTIRQIKKLIFEFEHCAKVITTYMINTVSL